MAAAILVTGEWRLPNNKFSGCRTNKVMSVVPADRRNIICRRFSYISGSRNNSQLAIFQVTGRILHAKTITILFVSVPESIPFWNKHP